MHVTGILEERRQVQLMSGCVVFVAENVPVYVGKCAT